MGVGRSVRASRLGIGRLFSLALLLSAIALAGACGAAQAAVSLCNVPIPMSDGAVMRANVGAGRTMSRAFAGSAPWVYRRSGRPCRRCSTPVRGGRLGEQARAVFWCPTCQST